MKYQEFLERKSQIGPSSGFDPLWLPDFLFPFQRALCEWSIRKGRAAIFADCGLGKTPMQLVWAENVVRETNKPTLILTPLSVVSQTVREGEKFGIDCRRSSDGKIPNGARIIVTNYDRLHYFNPADFSGCVCDESGGIKHFDSKRTAEVTEFLRTLPYRLLCTATAAPNDYVELGTSSEALGELGFQDMITKFFKKETSKDHLGWGRTKYQMKGWADNDFWRWVCSWARAVRKPSDLGFEDGDFQLPDLITNEHIVQANKKRDGFLFDVPAETSDEMREERRRTIVERCEKVAGLINGTGKPAVAWCHLNPEGDLLKSLIPDSVQVSGSDDDDEKEEKFLAFSTGQVRVMVTKPAIASWGMNWQHCSHVSCFPSDSFEQYYQLVRRCWRYGQENDVTVDVVASEGARGVLANLNRKAAACAVMFQRLVDLMNDHLNIKRSNPFTDSAVIPEWLSERKSCEHPKPRSKRAVCNL